MTLGSDRTVVVHSPETQQITLPEKMKLREAHKLLGQKLEELETDVILRETYPYLPCEGAWAVSQVLEREYGWGIHKRMMGFFGPVPAQTIEVPIAFDEKVSVPFGLIGIPGFEGEFHLGVQLQGRGGMPLFRLSAKTTKEFEPVFKRFASQVGAELRSKSVFLGRALEVELPGEDEDDAETLASWTPKFIDLTKVDATELMFPAEIEADIEDLVFTPVRHREAARRARMGLKRGILLHGPYGCGKTLTALVLAKLCEANKVTFVMVRDPRQIVNVIRWALNRQPCVVFCEDIDRVAAGSERTVELDAILNTLDGLGSKGSELFTVFTSNHVETLGQALMRPGRIDKAIEVGPPDAKTAERLLRRAAGRNLELSANLTMASVMLAGQIPARIRETAEQAKWSALRRTGHADFVLTQQDLERAARSVVRSIPKAPALQEPSEVVRAAEVIATALSRKGSASASQMAAYDDGYEAGYDDARSSDTVSLPVPVAVRAGEAKIQD